MELTDRADFSLIRYANCWEDADILCEALQPQPGKRLLSIASAGDNALALLAEGADVVAADLSPAQLACVELRMAGFRRLEYPELLAFLGVRSADDRPAIYARLQGDLSRESRRFWDDRRAEIEAGVIHAGKFERYFRTFRRRVLPWIHRRRTVEALLAEKSEAERLEFYEHTWNNFRWRLLFRIFFSRRMMGRLGRDPEFFRYVKGSVAKRILARTEHALTKLPTHANPYLRYILQGELGPTLPRYLRPEKFEAIRGRLDHLTLHQGPIEDAAAARAGEGFDGFSLSDIFEYLDAPTGERVYEKLLAHARPQARLAYWNMLVPRRAPASVAERVQPLEELSAELLERDLAFFYSAFVVEEVR